MFQIYFKFAQHFFATSLSSHLGTIHSEAFAVVGRKKENGFSLICKDFVLLFFLGIFFIVYISLSFLC